MCGPAFCKYSSTIEDSALLDYQVKHVSHLAKRLLQIIKKRFKYKILAAGFDCCGCDLAVSSLIPDPVLLHWTRVVPLLGLL